MNVRPYPGESNRYLVQSDSRPDLEHVVDMEWQECPGDQVRPLCGCEESFIKGKQCKHIKRVQEWLGESTTRPPHAPSS